MNNTSSLGLLILMNLPLHTYIHHKVKQNTCDSDKLVGDYASTVHQNNGQNCSSWSIYVSVTESVHECIYRQKSTRSVLFGKVNSIHLLCTNLTSVYSLRVFPRQK